MRLQDVPTSTSLHRVNNITMVGRKLNKTDGQVGRTPVYVHSLHAGQWSRVLVVWKRYISELGRQLLQLRCLHHCWQVNIALLLHDLRVEHDDKH